MKKHRIWLTIALCVAGILLIGEVTPLFATVTPYPAYPNEPVSTQFSVTADGQSILVHSCVDFHAIDYARFPFTGSVKVAVTVRTGTITSCSISPRVYNIVCTKNGNTVSFTLDRPRKLILNIDGKELAIFAEAPEVNPPRLGDANVKNIMDYGIDATGTIMMKNNVKIYLAPDALITASLNRDDFSAIPRIGLGNAAFVFFDNTVNTRIFGRGTLNARGFTRRPNKKDLHGFKLHGCRNTIFDGVVMLDSWTWTWHPVDCDTISAVNVKIINPKEYWWGDGFDFDVCRDGLVDDCFYWGGDDATCIKGTRGAPLKPCERLAFRNCVLSTTCNGMRLGFKGESNWASVKDITFENVHILSSGKNKPYVEAALKIYSENTPFENVSFTDCSVESEGPLPEGCIFDFAIGYNTTINFTNLTLYGSFLTMAIGPTKVHINCLKVNDKLIGPDYHPEAAGISVMGGGDFNLTFSPCQK